MIITGQDRQRDCSHSRKLKWYHPGIWEPYSWGLWARNLVTRDYLLVSQVRWRGVAQTKEWLWYPHDCRGSCSPSASSARYVIKLWRSSSHDFMWSCLIEQRRVVADQTSSSKDQHSSCFGILLTYRLSLRTVCGGKMLAFICFVGSRWFVAGMSVKDQSLLWSQLHYLVLRYLHSCSSHQVSSCKGPGLCHF